MDSRSELSPGPNSAGGVGIAGDNVVRTTPTQEIPGDIADKVSLAIVVWKACGDDFGSTGLTTEGIIYNIMLHEFE